MNYFENIQKTGNTLFLLENNLLFAMKSNRMNILIKLTKKHRKKNPKEEKERRKDKRKKQGKEKSPEKRRVQK